MIAIWSSNMHGLTKSIYF